MTFTHALATNNYGESKFIVSTSAANGTHTTITSALAAATSGDTVFIRAGTYTENFTAKAGVHITSFPGDMTVANDAIISGTVTLTETGGYVFSNLTFSTNGATAVTSTGSNVVTAYFEHCTFYANNAAGITLNNANCNIICDYCRGFNSGANTMLVVTTCTAINFFHCQMNNGSQTTTASTLAAGTLRLQYSIWEYVLTSSGTGVFAIVDSQINTSGFNATILTVAGNTGNDFAVNSTFSSGSSSAVSVSAGATLQMTNCSIISTNTNGVTGAGAVKYDKITFRSTGVAINTTTQTAAVQREGHTLSSLQPAFLATHSVAQDNVTGAGAAPTVNFTTEVFDQASNYDGTNTFTAPYTGRYQLTTSVAAFNLTAAMTGGGLVTVTSNRNYSTNGYSWGAIRTNLNTTIATQTVIADMDAADTATVVIQISNGAGDTADLSGATANTYFSGYLIC